MATYTDWRAELCKHARTQHQALFRTMAEQGGRFHLYRYPTASGSNVTILREGAERPAGFVLLVPDVQALSTEQVSAKVSQALP